MHRSVVLILAACLLPLALGAQQNLSLEDAARLALAQNPSIRASEAAAKGAQERVAQTRAGYLPEVNYTESFQLGNNPVYVFGSLLQQHRFTSGNFALGSLNRPDPLTNFTSQLAMNQTLFDGNKTRDRLQAAHAFVDLANERSRQSSMDILMNVVDAYYTSLLAQENEKVSEDAYRAAQSALDIARSMREAGMTTEADELALRVHLAEVEDQRIRARNDTQMSLARLNDTFAAPLDTTYRLTTPLHPISVPSLKVEDYEDRALRQRPEAQQAQIGVKLAEIDNKLAHSALLPEVTAHGAFDVNRRTFGDQGGSDWMAGASLRLNLFRGFSDRSHIAETSFAMTQKEQEWQKMKSELRLQVRQSYLELQSAGSRIEAARSAVTEAEENHRIVTNRYEAQLTTVTELLRSQAALSAAKLRYLAAIFDQRIAAVHLERAAGSLDSNSDVLKP